MKKYLPIILIGLLLFCFGFSPHLGVIARKKAAGCIAGTTFSYNGDHSVDDDTACDSAGSPIAGTEAGEVTVDSDYVYVPSSNDYLRWVIDSTEFNGDEGTLWVSIYVVDLGVPETVGATPTFEVYYSSDSANNNLICYVDPSNAQVRCFHEGNGTANNAYGGNETLTYDTWYDLGVSWSVSESAFAVTCEISGQAAAWDEDPDDTITSWAAAADRILIGEDVLSAGTNDAVRVKDLVIVSGYQTADPR